MRHNIHPLYYNILSIATEIQNEHSVNNSIFSTKKKQVFFLSHENTIK